MNKLSKVTASVVAATLALMLPSLALADETGKVSLKLEGAAAVPLTSPQAHRFDAGGEGGATLLVNLTPWLAIGPTISVVGAPSTINNIDTGTAYQAGVAGLVRRPLDNSGKNWLTAASPWFGLDGLVLKTGDLVRPAGDVGVGVEFPVNQSRSFWVGPFFKYEDIIPTTSQIHIDKRDARLGIVGLSFEFGSGVKRPAAPQKAAPPPPPPPAPPPPPPPVVEEPKPLPPPVVVAPEKFEITAKVQFAHDSAALTPAANKVLEGVVKALNDHTKYSALIIGHASSEGKPEYNRKLSERRAESVRKYLVAHGVPASRLSVKAFGATKPFADNKTNDGRVANRRVEFEITLTPADGEKK